MITPRDMRASFNGKPLLERYKSRVGELRTERESFISHWKELSRYIQPRTGRFLIDDVNKGRKVHQDIINSVGGYALRVAVAGLMAGAMSPARPFFKLAPSNKELRELQPVQMWLEDVEQLILEVLNTSNFYTMAGPFLQDLLVHGTACMHQEDDFEDVARFYVMPIGSYMLAQDERQVPHVVVREFMLTVEQLVAKFGLENMSVSAQNLWRAGNHDSRIPVTHFVGPNEDFDPKARLGRASKRFVSDWYETGTSRVENKFLAQRGFDRFPVYATRWEVTGEDVYGTNCPGMLSLGDVKALQLYEKRKAQGVEKMVNPPLAGPASVRNVVVNALPGGLTVYDGDNTKHELKSLYNLQLPIDQIRAEIDAIERRIKENFFVELFLAITDIEGIQPRNEFDLSKRDQERLLQLGPVLQSIHGGFLDPVINRVFDRLNEAKLLPPPPEDLQGQDLKVEYISPLAMAQRAAGTEPLERYGQFVIGLASAYPSVLDKFDADQAADEYGFAIGAPAQVVVPDDRVAQIRADRAQQEQAAAAMEAAERGVDVAKTAADARTDGQNLLTDVASAARRA
jgi:hypothetical protein